MYLNARGLINFLFAFVLSKNSKSPWGEAICALKSKFPVRSSHSKNCKKVILKSNDISNLLFFNFLIRRKKYETQITARANSKKMV